MSNIKVALCLSERLKFKMMIFVTAEPKRLCFLGGLGCSTPPPPQKKKKLKINATQITTYRTCICHNFEVEGGRGGGGGVDRSGFGRTQ